MLKIPVQQHCLLIIILPLLFNHTGVVSACSPPGGYSQTGDAYYKLHGTDFFSKKFYSGAKTKCEGETAHLPVITNQQQWDAVTGLMGNC